ncbi:MAG: hypothetical protein OJF55_001649 [Rhodanobacteraceae bacterium]|jgi:hypothetical protein|nr:MAG: hypothetical protein OJF55_001649 [Rhodanobacteraceae bacterium]
MKYTASTSNERAGNGLRRNGLRGALALAGGALLLGGHAPASTAGTVPAPAAAGHTTVAVHAAPAVADVSNLLAAALRAYAGHKVVAPVGDNAIEYYVAVLAKDPGNRVATDALREIFPYGVSDVRAAIARGDFSEARREINLLARADPHNYTVVVLDSELAARQGRTPRSQSSAGDAARHVAVASGDAAGRHVLVVRASAASWVEVAGDGKVESGMLRVGESKTYYPKGQVSVTLGNASDIAVTADRRPVDVDRFRRGKVARMVLFVPGESGENVADVRRASNGGRGVTGSLRRPGGDAEGRPPCNDATCRVRSVECVTSWRISLV